MFIIFYGLQFSFDIVYRRADVEEKVLTGLFDMTRIVMKLTGGLSNDEDCGSVGA
jgi:hypothetical protein